MIRVQLSARDRDALDTEFRRTAEWTVERIAGRLVKLKVVESISGRTVGRVLKKAGSSRGRRRRGACRVG